MPPKAPLRTRRSMNEIYKDFVLGSGLKANRKRDLQKPLIDLIRAWKGIQALPHEGLGSENSFFEIASYHGSPFRGAGYGDRTYWGGYCNHGNVLFPPWHRAYCLRLEDALRSVPGCEDVTLPYLDETGPDSRENGFPAIFNQPKFELDGEEIDNPLYSYQFPVNVTDATKQTQNLYTKNKGYRTVRYPLSGLVGTEDARTLSEKHNSRYTDEEAAERLNDNVRRWLGGEGVMIDGRIKKSLTRRRFHEAFNAPNYTVYSNTTSAKAWNNLHAGEHGVFVTSIETPHNDIHLALGGFEVPGKARFSAVEGANGDMGENDTAAFDPIFFFHHAEIDRQFWRWQKKNGCTDRLEIISKFPGTNSVDDQGPSAGVAAGVFLDLDSPLEPFLNPKTNSPYTSQQLINIETQLGYTYDALRVRGSAFLKGSEDPDYMDVDGASRGGAANREQGKRPRVPDKKEATRKRRRVGSGSEVNYEESDEDSHEEIVAWVRVDNVNKTQIAGSFLIEVYATLPGEERQLVAIESALNRQNRRECRNCEANGVNFTMIPLYGFTNEEMDTLEIDVKVAARPVEENLSIESLEKFSTPVFQVVRKSADGGQFISAGPGSLRMGRIE